jgi:nicotinate-nucleotide adenylyltransferase
MGTDSLLNLPNWKNGSIILNEYKIWAYLRPGFDIKDSPAKFLTIKEAPLLMISASYIRDLIEKHKSVRFLLPDEVMAEIERSGYYRLKPPA